MKSRVGQIVYLAFSPDETLMGFAFPKEERDALVASDPHQLRMPETSDLRFNWVVVALDAIDDDETRELVQDARRIVAPKVLATEVRRPAQPAKRAGRGRRSARSRSGR